MFSKDEFNEKTKSLKDKYVKLFSNTMLMGAELDRLSSKSNTELLIDNDEIFILEPDNGFSHMYCVIPAADAAARIKTFSSEKHLDEIVFDLTGRSKGVIKMAQELCELGIEPYAKYNRFTLSKRKTLPSFYRNICCSPDISFGFATEDEAETISEIFKDAFDKYTSHVPFTVEKVKDHINKNEICCAYYKGKTAAAFCFERLDEKNIHLNVVASAREYDSFGLGMLLYEFVLDQFSEDTFFICWIEENNSASINMHDSFGFVKDEKMLFYFYIV